MNFNRVASAALAIAVGVAIGACFIEFLTPCSAGHLCLQWLNQRVA